MASGKGLTPEQNERVREMLRELLRRGASQSELAPKLGVTQSMLSGVLSGRSGTSYLSASKIARLLGTDIHEILGESRPPLRPTTGAARRELAAELAREDRVQESAITSVLAEEVRPEDAEQSTLWWARRMRIRESEMEAGDRALPATAIRRRKA